MADNEDSFEFEKGELRFYPQFKWEKHCKPFFGMLDCASEDVTVMTLKWVSPAEGEILFLNEEFFPVEPDFAGDNEKKFLKKLDKFAKYIDVYEEMKELAEKFDPKPTEYGLFVSRYPLEVTENYARPARAGFFALVDPDSEIYD